MSNQQILLLLGHIETLVIELYVMDQEAMVLQDNLVNKHVLNTLISHYKMVMDKLDNVSVKMIYLMLLDMELLIVE